MDNNHDPADMEEVLNRIEAAAANRAHISIEEMMNAVGHRTFGPLVLLVGLILITPLSGVPGMPTLMGLLVLLTLGQLLVGREHFWLPRWLVQRQIPQQKLVRGLTMLRPAARRVDSVIRPRLTPLASGPGLYVMALACILISLVMPVTELVLFSSSIAGLILMVFGLAMISRDGLVALLAWGLMLTAPMILVG
jgi:hypothetical protein